jgi:hypothetical protein
VDGYYHMEEAVTGTAEYELARRLLKATYHLKYAINAIRSPMVTNIERQEAEKEAGLGEPQPDPNSPGRSHAHESEKASTKQDGRNSISPFRNLQLRCWRRKSCGATCRSIEFQSTP